MEHVHAVARAEARDDVADRVDEHVPHVQRPRGVREHLEDVALRLDSGSFETWNALASSQTRCQRSSIVFASYLSIVSLSSLRGTKKPLAREAPRERRGVRRARSLTYGRSCFTSRKRYQARSGDARALPGLRPRRAGELVARRSRACRSSPTASELRSSSTARRRCAAVRAHCEPRSAAGRVFYGTKAFRERRSPPAAARRGHRRRRRIVRRARVRPCRRADR